MIDFKGNIIVKAGPGSGKTQFLADRASFLLSENGYSQWPRKILALSFKRDAAKNLASRAEVTNSTNRFDSITFDAFVHILRTIIERFAQLSEYANDKHYYKNVCVDLSTILPNHPQFVQAIRSTYSDVLLDEFQDCSQYHYDLIHLLFRGANTRVVAVGDPNQSIMKFTQNLLENPFERFGEDFCPQEFRLNFNFRSKPRIQNLQNEIIGIPQAIPQPQGFVAHYTFVDAKEQAKAIASHSAKLIKNGLPPEDIAVLVTARPHKAYQDLSAAFDAEGCPFENYNDFDDITDFEAGKIIYNFVLACLGGAPKAHRIIQEKLDSVNGDYTLPELTPPIQFETLIEHLKKYCQITEANLEASDKQNQAVSRWLHKACKGHVEGTPSTHLMTIHKSKGLEFHTVFLIGLEDDNFWDDPTDQQKLFYVAATRAKEEFISCNINEPKQEFASIVKKHAS